MDALLVLSPFFQGTAIDEESEVFEDEALQPALATQPSPTGTAGPDTSDAKQTASQAIQHIVNSSWTGILAALSELLRVSSNPATTEALLRCVCLSAAAAST